MNEAAVRDLLEALRAGWSSLPPYIQAAATPLLADAHSGEECYTVEEIRRAFAEHATPDGWGVPHFYENGLIAALRGEYS
jgi:hypothetical protein